MKNLLKEKLRKFIEEDHPEMVHQFSPDAPFSTYLDDQVALIEPLLDELQAAGQPDYILEQICFSEMVKDFLPSKYHYIKAVMEEEFPEEFNQLSELGVLKFSILNIIERAQEVFETFEFSQQNQDNRFLRYAMIVEIHDYILSQQKN